MAWRLITTAHVRLTPPETAALRNISGSDQICAEILADVVGEFVSAIRSGGNAFTDDGSIPDLARLHVINRTRWLWLCEFPALKAFQTAERKALNDGAEKFLAEIAAGKPPVEAPANPTSADAPGNAVEIATSPDPARGASRRKLDGLV